MDSRKAGFADDGLSALIKAAHRVETLPEGLEQRVMLGVARRAVMRSRRKAKLGLVASLSGLAMLLAGCIALLLGWFPVAILLREGPNLQAFADNFAVVSRWLPISGEWGGWLVAVLLLAGACGFIYYLHTLFADVLIPSDK